MDLITMPIGDWPRVAFNRLISFLSLFIVVTLTIGCGKAPPPPDSPSPAVGANADPGLIRLCAHVSDPDADKLQVRYFGRVRTDSGSKKFTIIILPDTQHYTQEPKSNYGGDISMFYAQTKWVVENRASRNIVFVGHLGDCVQNGDNPPVPDKQEEWKKAKIALGALEDPLVTGLAQGIPFGVCVGNHDQTPNGSAAGTTKYYNQYFGVDHFAGRSYYGGHFGSNNDNYYEFFSASGIDFMVISLEYDQSEEFSSNGVLDWTEQLVKTHGHHKVIVMTHYVINEDKTFSPQARSIYERLKIYPNFGLLLGGHRHTTNGEAQRTDVYQGNTVHSMLSDYQARGNGGDGLLRILEFDPSHNRIAVKTYSPYTHSYETDPDSQFELSFNMLPFVGQINNVSSGSTPCFNWDRLSPNSSYEWNVELYDGLNVTAGPVWNFSTPNR